MKKLALASLVVAALAVPAIANAQTGTAPAAAAPAAAAPAMTAPAATTATTTTTTTAPAATAMAPATQIMLDSGSLAKVAADGTVTVSSDNGTTWTPAPDGTWKGKDGSSIVVQNGKKI